MNTQTTVKPQGDTSPIVFLSTRVKDSPSWSAVDDTTEVIHLSGLPFVWAIEKMCEMAPRLRVLQIPPSTKKAVSAPARAILREHNVTLRLGCVSPNASLPGISSTTPHYLERQAFMRGLEGEMLGKFCDLLRHDIEVARMAQRYFCLCGEPPLSQEQVSRKFGLKGVRGERRVSLAVNTVLSYLDPDRFPPSEKTKEGISAIVRQIDKLRAEEKEKKEWEDRLKVHGLKPSDVPDGLLPKRFPQFALLRRFHRTNRFVEKAGSDRHAMVLEMRFGLGDHGRCHVFDEVGKKLGVTKERARQIELDALKRFGLKP